jgi:hypothetical protein
MSAVFADTSFFLAVLNPRDAAHGAFVEWMRSARHEIVTTEFVLLELGNALSARTLRTLFAALIDELRSDPASSVVPLSSAALADGVQLFRTRADKEWYTDGLHVLRNHAAPWTDGRSDDRSPLSSSRLQRAAGDRLKAQVDACGGCDDEIA